MSFIVVWGQLSLKILFQAFTKMVGANACKTPSNTIVMPAIPFVLVVMLLKMLKIPLNSAITNQSRSPNT